MEGRNLQSDVTGQSTLSILFTPRDAGPSHARTRSGLEPYSGTWDELSAAHLLRRTTFGPTRTEILTAASASLDAILEQLFSPREQPPIPPDPNVPGRDWTTTPFSDIAQINYQYDRAIKEWWVGLMMSPGISLRENMVLFWHNHLASQAEVVRDARFMYRQNSLFRKYALGNIKSLIKEITLDAAMLRYLNGYLNKIPSPDENYARELLELFTIGNDSQSGSEVFYTEEDVRAAARVLTGWTVNRYEDPPDPVFVERNHDTGDKQFSEFFENTVIRTTQNPDGSVNGLQEVNDLIEMIFRHPETPRAFCRKLYRWFVYHDIDEAARSNIVSPLAAVLKEHDFELMPVLNALLRSEHFFEPLNVGCLIKNPPNHVAGTIRRLVLPFPGESSSKVAELIRWCVHTMAHLGMDLLEPPNVAGWEAYHQAPGFSKHWINTTTLPARRNVTDSTVYGIRPHGTTDLYAMDVIAYARGLRNPADPFQLVEEVAGDLLPPIQNGKPVTQEQKEYLLYHVMRLVRNDEYEWTAEWNSLGANPEDNQARMVVSGKLRALLRYVMHMAEYQLL